MRSFLIASCALAMPVWAGAQSTGLFLYAAGRSVKDQAITLQSWGSGNISETDEAAFQGATSIRVTMRNFFQGGRIIFDKPISIDQLFGDKNNLLLFTMKLPGVMAAMKSEMASGPPGGKGMVGADDRPQDPGSRRGGERSTRRDDNDAKTEPAKLRVVRLILTTTDGKKSEAYVPLPTAGADANGWSRVGLPLQAISGLEATNKIVREIAISGDATTSFFIGEVQIVNDSTPLFGEPNVRELNLGLGSEYTFSAWGQGGASVLRYTWDFDSSDGIQVDAEGQVVKRRFRRPGDYVITLTVSDAFGLKQAYSTTIKATINP